MWSDITPLRVTGRDTLIFAGQGRRAVVLRNPGPSSVRLHSGALRIDIDPGLVGALTAPGDIYVHKVDQSDEHQICEVQFAVSGT